MGQKWVSRTVRMPKGEPQQTTASTECKWILSVLILDISATQLPLLNRKPCVYRTTVPYLPVKSNLYLDVKMASVLVQAVA